MPVIRSNVGSTFKEWSGWTTAHGIPHVAASPNKVWRIFWTLVTLVAFGLLVYFLVMLFIKYFSFPSNVNVNLKFEKTKFPSVTMCHLNPYFKEIVNTGLGTDNVDVLAQSVDLQDVESLYMESRNNEFRTDQKQDQIKTLGLDKTNEQDVHSAAQRWVQYLQKTMHDQNTLHDVTYDASELVLACTYNVKPCYASNLRRRFHPTFGYCYTFNVEGAYYVERAGAPYGLQMLLRTDHSAYSKTTDISGFRVTVHKPDTEPFIDTQGTYAAPGFTTAMALSFLQTERQPWPWGDCDSDVSTKTHYYNGSYSVEGCHRSCLQDQIIAKCGCYDPNLVAKAGVTPCSKGDQVDTIKNNMACVEGVLESYIVVEQCSCPPPCSVAIYDVTTSISKWPAAAYAPSDCHNNTLKRRYWQKDETWSAEGTRNDAGTFTAGGSTNFFDSASAPATNEAKCKKWLHENSLRIEVYMERMNYQVVQQDKAYGVVNLISDCGGQLGLFLGFSLVTIIEVLTLLFLIVCGCDCLMETKQDKPKPAKAHRAPSPMDNNDYPPPPSQAPTREDSFMDRPKAPNAFGDPADCFVPPTPFTFDNYPRRPETNRRQNIAACNKWKAAKAAVGPSPKNTDVYGDWDGPSGSLPYPPPPV